MAQGFDQLVSALQVRFDFQSARVMTREALERAGLKEQSDYTPEDLQKFVDGLNGLSRNLDRVWTQLGIAPSGEPLPAPPAPKAEPAPEPVVEAAAEPAPVVVEAAPEPAPEPVVEAAPEAEPAVEAAPEAEAAPAEDSVDNAWGGKKKKNKNKYRGDDAGSSDE